MSRDGPPHQGRRPRPGGPKSGEVRRREPVGSLEKGVCSKSGGQRVRGSFPMCRAEGGVGAVPRVGAVGSAAEGGGGGDLRSSHR